MHTNMLEDIHFNEYERCNYIIITGQGDITPKTRFTEIMKFFEGEPIEIGIRRHAHGYKSTQYYKYPGIIFEVMHTGYISSVILSYAD